MRSDEQEIVATLDQVADAFKAHKPKGTSKNFHFPQNLRMLAVSALSNDCSIVDVAKAAGVVPKSIRNWRDESEKKQSTLKFKRLKVVAERAIAPMPATVGVVKSPWSRVTLQSGVVIELPASELSTELLHRLCGLRLSQ